MTTIAYSKDSKQGVNNNYKVSEIILSAYGSYHIL